jgi:hypothetical protein
MEGPQVAIPHGHPYARKFPEKKYFLVIWSQEGSSTGISSWPPLCQEISWQKIFFRSFGPREGPQVATSIGHLYARKFPDKKIFFLSFGPRKGPRLASSHGHTYARKFPDKKIIFWSFGPRKGPQVAAPYGHPYARKFPDKKYFFGHLVPGRVPKWPLLMATPILGSSLTKTNFSVICSQEGPRLASPHGHPYARKFPVAPTLFFEAFLANI